MNPSVAENATAARRLQPAPSAQAIAPTTSQTVGSEGRIARRYTIQVTLAIARSRAQRKSGKVTEMAIAKANTM